MIIGSCKVYMSADWVDTLKEKRSVVKPIVERVRNRFNVSIAEVGENDSHRRIVLGFACVSNSRRHADEIVHNVLHFIENSSDAVVDDAVVEIL